MSLEIGGPVNRIDVKAKQMFCRTRRKKRGGSVHKAWS